MPATLRLMLEPQQGGTYAQFLRVARAAEDAGYDAVFRSDHLLGIGTEPRPALEAWTTLAALARDTMRVRLGTLVTPMTFRHPALLAREVATVDELSGGRVELGVGTGWFEPEHRTLGIPFASLGERTDRLAECVEAMTLLWRGEPVSYQGRYVHLDNAHALPRPVQDPFPIVVGGLGGARSVALGARFAAEYNTTSADPARAGRNYDAVRAACAAIGRSPESLRLSWMGTVLVARDEAALHKRAEAMARWTGQQGSAADLIAATAQRSIVGVHDQAAERLAEYVCAGAERIYARIWDLDDLDQISEIAEQVVARAA